jgi:hypothetical protein
MKSPLIGAYKRFRKKDGGAKKIAFTFKNAASFFFRTGKPVVYQLVVESGNARVTGFSKEKNSRGRLLIMPRFFSLLTSENFNADPLQCLPALCIGQPDH